MINVRSPAPGHLTSIPEATVERRYKVVRKLQDGEQVLIGRFEDVNEARKWVAAFSEYWPGDYVIVQPKYEQAADR